MNYSQSQTSPENTAAPPAGKVIKPQDGPQTVFMSTPADIAVYGGAAGGGKTWALLLEVLRNIDVAEFGAVIFRRTFPQITNEGGLWDESNKLYPLVDAEPTKSALNWKFPSGARLSFKHMQYEQSKEEWQGSQIPLIGFDELTHFTRTQFLYMLSRNRSVSGVIPYVRATCNPDANSWVKEFLSPWLQRDYKGPGGMGRANSGEIRYFSGTDGVIRWHTANDYAYEQIYVEPQDRQIKTITFVRASVFDNKELLKTNPQYLANLRSLPLVEQERLLHGNWDIVESGNMFRAEWFQPFISWIDLADINFKRIIRFWDLAATKPSEVEKKKNDPDWSCGVLLGVDYSGMYYLLDCTMTRDTPQQVEAMIKQTAMLDYDTYGKKYEVWMEEEPGSSGKFVTDHFTRVVLKGFRFSAHKSTGSKIARAKPVSAEAQNKRVKMVKGAWNDSLLAMLTAFPSPDAHDDPVDALSGAYNVHNLSSEDDIYTPRMTAARNRHAISSNPYTTTRGINPYAGAKNLNPYD